MVRSELLDALATEYPGLRPDEIKRVADVFFDEIAQRLVDNGRVELREFGAFTTRTRNARAGRNPRTGEAVSVAAKRVLHFKPALALRARLLDDPALRSR